MSDIPLPSGQPVGYVSRGAGADIQTVSPLQFSDIKSQLMRRAEAVSAPSGFDGAWYKRSDGTVFGIRTSSRSGPTIDVISSDNPALLGSLLGDLSLLPDGNTADPAAWGDWLHCVEKARRGNVDPSLVITPPTNDASSE